MNASILIFVVVFCAVIGVIAIVSQIRARKRTLALTALCQTIGFRFEGDQWSDPSRVAGLRTAPLFERGDSRKFKNIMTGQYAGFDTRLFDYCYTTGAAKSRQTWTQTVVVFSQDLWLPIFGMRPENFLDRIGEAFVHMDIDFDSHPGFSHRYLLRGPNEEKIRQIFTPALLSFLEQLPRDEKWSIEGNGQLLIIYCSNVTVAAESIQQLLDKTSSIAKMFLSCCGRSAFPMIRGQIN